MDPSIDVAEFREAGHRLIDRIAAYLEQVEEHPLLASVEPAALRDSFAEPLPREAQPLEAVLEELEELEELDSKLLPFCTQVNHPGYVGLITPSPTPVGILGDLLASALNQNVGAYSIGPAAVALERRTVRWLTGLVGYPDGAGGNLTSGGTMANFIALKLARDRISGDRAQHDGVTSAGAVYTSEERHVSVDKAVDAVGMGRRSLRYLAPGLPGERLAELHARVARGVEQGGRFWISTTELKGHTWFRVNPVNFRTRTEHIESLFDLLVEECPAMACELGTAAPSAA